MMCIQKYQTQIKTIKEIKASFPIKEAPKNRNTKLLLEELYIKKQNIYRKLTLRKNLLERVNKELNTQVLKVSVSVK